MRLLEDCEVMFEDFERGELVWVGYKFEPEPEITLPINFIVDRIDYDLFLTVAGIKVPLSISPECVLEITGNSPKTIWLSACGNTDPYQPARLVFMGQPEFCITIEVLDITFR